MNEIGFFATHYCDCVACKTKSARYEVRKYTPRVPGYEIIFPYSGVADILDCFNFYWKISEKEREFYEVVRIN